MCAVAYILQNPNAENLLNIVTAVYKVGVIEGVFPSYLYIGNWRLRTLGSRVNYDCVHLEVRASSTSAVMGIITEMVTGAMS